MKIFASAVAFILLMSVLTYSQDSEYMNSKLEEYKKKEISGIVFTSASLAFATLGTILMVANSENTYSYSDESGAGVGFTNAAGGIGLLITLPAPPLLIVGIVKWVKGAKYKKYYSNL